YERSLRYVSTHILARELTERSVREALRSGHAYVSHDWLCDARGFAFVLTPKGAPKAASAVMGDAVSFKPEDVLRVATPLVSRLKLMKNGEVIQTANTDHLEFEVKSPGVYRVEAWLDLDGEQRPWIWSNPIYIR